jgi:hypothetical protein
MEVLLADIETEGGMCRHEWGLHGEGIQADRSTATLVNSDWASRRALPKIPFSFSESVSAGGGAYLFFRLVGLAAITASPHLRLPLEEPSCLKTEDNRSIAKVQAAIQTTD